jgi:hypothetical protein
MTHDRESPPILIWHSWLPSSFANVLFFHAKYYADISGSRKRNASEFFTRNTGSKHFIFDVLHVSSRWTEDESLKGCHATSTSWNTPALPSNGLCDFLDRERVVVLFGIFPLLYGVSAASGYEVPESPMTKLYTEKCMISIIWSISAIQSLLELTNRMKYNSQYFCHMVIPDIRQTISSSSRRKTLKIILLHLDNAQFHDSRLFQKRLNPHKPTECRIHLLPQTKHQVTSSPLVIWKKNPARHPSLRATSGGRRSFFAIWQMFSEISEMALNNMLTNWITRLSWAMKKGGECYTT